MLSPWPRGNSRIQASLHRSSVPSQMVPNRYLNIEETPNTSQQGEEYPSFHSKVGFTLGGVFVYQKKLFICWVRKEKILRAVCLVKQKKTLPCLSSLLPDRTETDFFNFWKWFHSCLGYRFASRRVTSRRQLSTRTGDTTTAYRKFISDQVMRRSWKVVDNLPSCSRQLRHFHCFRVVLRTP